MTDVVSSVNEPAYLASLALHSAPFNYTVEPDLFYSVGQAGHRLNLLLHLVRASDKVANLVAGEGYGKSSLLTQLAARTGDEIRLSFIDAEQSKDINAVLGQCMVAFGISSQDIDSAADPVVIFQQHLLKLSQLGITPVLLIDNAMALSAELRASIAVWLSWKSERKYLLQAVVASQTAFQFNDQVDGRLQVVSLPVLSESELSSYLMSRLKKVGFKGDNPFLDKDLKRIYQQSSGIPLIVNQLAHQQLLGIKPTSTSWWQSLVSFVQRWIGLLLVAASILLLLLFQEPINAWFTAEPEDTVDESPVIIAAEDDLPIVVTEEQSQRDELADLLAEISDSEQQADVVEKQEVKPLQKPVQQDTAPVAVEVSPTVEPSVAIPSFLKKDWVLAQEKSHYTFQLMGSWEKEEVYEFIDKYALVKDVAVFESMRGGRIWYVLLYGSYANKKAAIAASQAWPTPLNTVPSWLRLFENVHQQIKNKAVIE